MIYSNLPIFGNYSKSQQLSKMHTININEYIHLV